LSNHETSITVDEAAGNLDFGFWILNGAPTLVGLSALCFLLSALGPVHRTNAISHHKLAISHQEIPITPWKNPIFQSKTLISHQPQLISH
jgi:hypothetical protein